MIERTSSGLSYDWRKSKSFQQARQVVIGTHFDSDGWGECHICGLPLHKNDSLGYKELALHIDHIIAPQGDSTLYYDTKNLSPAHALCNQAKGDMKLTSRLRGIITQKILRFLRAERISVSEGKLFTFKALTIEEDESRVLPMVQKLSSGVLW